MKRTWYYAVIAVLWGVLGTGCENTDNPLAPYEGERPLVLQRVTQSATPDIQWVGGRVAAVGVNRGSEAALDETLVWLMAADGNEINSHVTVGQNTAEDLIQQYGGLPADRLEDNTEYTFWLADEEALQAGLATGQLNEHTFIDTTLTTRLILAGRSRGELDIELQVTRDENLMGQRFIIDWTPADVPVRRIAIRQGSGSPGFTDLVWHVVLPDEAPDGILPPVVIGEPPEGTQVAVPWVGEFTEDTYTLWMANSEWDGSFGFSPPGMAMFIMFASNFE